MVLCTDVLVKGDDADDADNSGFGHNSEFSFSCSYIYLLSYQNYALIVHNFGNFIQIFVHKI